MNLKDALYACLDFYEDCIEKGGGGVFHELKKGFKISIDGAKSNRQLRKLRDKHLSHLNMLEPKIREFNFKEIIEKLTSEK
jgi:hypothetical protein